MPEDNKPTPDIPPSSSKNPAYSPLQDDAALQNTSLASIESESAGDDIRPTDQNAPASSLGAQRLQDTDRQPSPLVLNGVNGTPSKSNKKRPVLIAVVAAVIVLLIGGGAGAYFWYQNPEKVVLDGVIHAAQAKTSIVAATAEITTESAKATVKIDGKGGVETGSSGAATVSLELKDFPKIDLEGEGVYGANGDIYFRAKNIAKTYDSVVDAFIDQAAKSATSSGTKITNAQKAQVRSSYDSLFKPVITKVDNKWIKISVNDMKEMNKEYGREYECTQNVLKKVTTDKEFGNQLRDRYMKNKVFTITETSEKKGDSKGYQIDVNKEASKKFGEELKTIPLYKELEACSKSSSDSKSSGRTSESNTDTKIILWIDQWSHVITDFNVTATDNKNKNQTVKIEGTTQFNQSVTITPPKDAMSIKELEKEFESAMPSLDTPSARSTVTPSSRL